MFLKSTFSCSSEISRRENIQLNILFELVKYSTQNMDTYNEINDKSNTNSDRVSTIFIQLKY